MSEREFAYTDSCCQVCDWQEEREESCLLRCPLCGSETDVYFVRQDGSFWAASASFLQEAPVNGVVQ